MLWSVGELQKNRRHRAGALGLFTLTVLAALAVGDPLTSSPALAACSTFTPADGDTVTCVGPAPETNQVGTGNENQVTVNVLSGASITVGADTLGIALNAQAMS